MRGKHDWHAVWHFIELFNEHCALGAQCINDEFVVNNFVPDIDGRAVFFDGEFDDVDRAVYAGAKAARRRN